MSSDAQMQKGRPLTGAGLSRGCTEIITAHRAWDTLNVRPTADATDGATYGSTSIRALLIASL
ncbi:MAG: hypothetical protein KJ881_02045, partial [Gammaproteobacteria bacterium]|nr:hypothetical protein [Gammaproteobacteria bacterium]